MLTFGDKSRNKEAKGDEGQRVEQEEDECDGGRGVELNWSVIRDRNV